jgi:transposase-like protein
MKSEGRMATGTRRRYTEDFKQEAVRLVGTPPVPWLRWHGI